MPAVTSRTSAAERQRLILESAVELVLENGAGALSMPGVAKRAGVSVSLVYRHFPGRDHLLSGLLETVWSRNGAERARTTQDVLSAYLARVAQYGELVNELVVRPSVLPELEQRRRQLRERDVRRVTKLLRAEGHDARNARLVATMLEVALITGALHTLRGGSVESTQRVLGMALSLAGPVPA